MNEIEVYKTIIDKLKIAKNDIILVSSDLAKVFFQLKKNDVTFNPDFFLDYLMEFIGSDGTILLPSFNWDFCKGKTFDYNNTPSMTGSLSKIALGRKEFKRTRNPIYSFAVYGKHAKSIINLKHTSCFGDDSPFAFLDKNNGKNLFLGLDYKYGFTMDHYAEEKIGVSYRYHKPFKGKYIDENKNETNVEFSMYVRDLSLNVVTAISDNMDDILISNNCLVKDSIFGLNYSLINIKKTCQIMFEDIKNQGGLIYPKEHI
jgi:aminoglycoside 3-N-acetyltransferase